MSLRYGLSRVDLQTFDEDALREMAEQRHLSPDGDKDRLIDALVEDSYPVYPLPKFNDLTPQGVVFRYVITENGEPKGSRTLSDIYDSLVQLGVRDRETAKQLAHQQILNLVKFYGYAVTYTEETVQVQKRSK